MAMAVLRDQARGEIASSASESRWELREEVASGPGELLDVIPYRHSDEAQILGGRSVALCQAVGLTSENDFGRLYRPGFALGSPSAGLLAMTPTERRR